MSEQSYIRVKWLHSHPDEPVELWSELDADRFEVRKVEVWADGRVGYAARGREVGGTKLGGRAAPPLEEIASDPQFEPAEVSKAEFDRFWNSKVVFGRPGR